MCASSACTWVPLVRAESRYYYRYLLRCCCCCCCCSGVLPACLSACLPARPSKRLARQSNTKLVPKKRNNLTYVRTHARTHASRHAEKKAAKNQGCMCMIFPPPPPLWGITRWGKMARTKYIPLDNVTKNPEGRDGIPSFSGLCHSPFKTFSNGSTPGLELKQNNNNKYKRSKRQR